MLEIVAPATSPEGVRAAVQNGADAVYLGFGSFNSEPESCFTESEFASAVEYCHIRGVKVYLTIDTAVRESEFTKALDLARSGCEMGADAIELRDLGLLRALRQFLPETKLHLGMFAGIHSLGGVSLAAYFGADRVTLSPHLSLDEIKRIRAGAKIELELPCHGPICVSAPGTCMMSAFCTRYSASFGGCEEPCRRKYSVGEKTDGFFLSMRELCLAKHMTEICESSINSVRILSRGRGSEYSALTASLYSHAAKNGNADGRILTLLEKAFAPSGMGDNRFSGGAARFSPPGESPHRIQLLSAVHPTNLLSEGRLVQTELFGYVHSGEGVRIGARDTQGHSVIVQGDPPLPVAPGEKELTHSSLNNLLCNIGDSPFYCDSASSFVEPGLYMPVADIFALRRRALDELGAKRAEFPPPVIGEVPRLMKYLDPSAMPDINISVLSCSQLTPELAGLKPKVLYVPVDELVGSPESITPFWENGVTEICAVIPPVVHDGEADVVFEKLEALKALQVKQVLVSSLGQIVSAAAHGFEVRGDTGLGVFNSQCLRLLKSCKLISAAVSPELKFEEIKSLSKCIPLEAVMYGRLPLMTTESCVIKPALGICSCQSPVLLRSRRAAYPVVRAFGCRSTVYSHSKLFLASKMRDYARLGLWCIRLSFTTESREECVLAAQRYLSQNRYEPSAHTRGFYY